ncbi:MAG: methionyl-tRNA formyltransferase, partial [Pseudomonadota bacterium]
EAGHDVIGCYTQPDRPAGRGRVPQVSPVKRAALDAGVPVYQPTSLKHSDEQSVLAALGADLMVVVAYGLLLPSAVLEAPRLGCVNVHASLLPRWRGAAPIQRAILAGDHESGVCVMQMDEGLDTGAVWSRWQCLIDESTTAGDLHDVLAAAGADLMVQTLPDIAAQRRSPSPQNDCLSTYAAKLHKAEATVDWQQPAQQLARQVRAFNPWPVSQCSGPTGVIRLWSAQAAEQGDLAIEAAGHVHREDPSGIYVQTGEGVLVVTRLQLAGKRQMSAAEFVNGRSLLGLTLT